MLPLFDVEDLAPPLARANKSVEELSSLLPPDSQFIENNKRIKSLAYFFIVPEFSTTYTLSNKQE